MPLNKLPIPVVEAADRTHVWFNVILGYLVAASISAMPSWGVISPFAVARAFPHSQAIWSSSLAAFISVYVVGSFIRYENKHRGLIIIIGATLCFLWYLALALCMARQSYVDPRHANGLSPLIFFFLGTLYAHRAILYSNTFTGTRWALNPFQLYTVCFLMFASLAQVIIGVSPGSVQAMYDKSAQVSLALANLIGALVCLVGLHLRNLEQGLWIELWGYISLVATMAFYVLGLVAANNGIPIATLGFTLSEAFVFASLHRSIQIGAYKWAMYRKNYDAQDRLRPKLTHRTDQMLSMSEDPSVN